MPEIDRVAEIPHPREMLSLLGQEAAERQFLQGYTSGKLHHAFLLAGPEGTGKATFAYRAARFLFEEAARENDADALFEAPPAESLAVSASAKATQLVARESHPDLAVLKRRYDPKGKRFRAEISVEETRDALQLLTKTAAFGGWRVVIVDAADDLNTASANALLKTLEEPPAKTVFFLVAHQPGGCCRPSDRAASASISSHFRRTVLRPFSVPSGDRCRTSRRWRSARRVPSAAPCGKVRAAPRR